MVLDLLLENPFQVVTAIHIALFLAASLLLLYPAIAYAQNVAYTEGIVGLSVGLFLVTVANVLGLLIEYDVILPDLYSSFLVTSILNLGASTCATIGIYYFARQFIDTGQSSFEAETHTDTTGGFEDADDD
ncbi:hypothetical protein [Haloarchaeobius sp. HME9146]|uniref:hypothetical protein n=1 Tax=unclassified Haloarchaeobius TaxID=2614452 RepID=UPI0021C13573|nr:hypothetical protein [Haloarchaeobius sp. HME9146]MCT9096818.1 hypothetical protein [Haloarchaeobius sp. HME9146]